MGRNFAWRTYFHGDYVDHPQNSAPPFRLSQTQLSALLKSTATQTWKIAVSTPLRHPDSELFNGVVVVTFEVGRFLSFFEQGNAEESRFAVLVDKRAGPNHGMILQHPLFTKIIQQQKKLPDHFTQYRVKSSSSDPSKNSVYRDPLGKDANGRAFDKPWIAADASVMLPNTDKQKATSSGLVVIVQEDQVTAVAPVFQLEQDMRREVLFALLLICVTVLMAWYLVLRRLMTGADRKNATIVQHDHSSTPA